MPAGTAQEAVEVVRAVYDSYQAQDRVRAEHLIADDYVFTSPQVDHIDRAAFFSRCFPTAGRLASQELVHLTPVDEPPGPGGERRVFVLYHYVLRDGSGFRNVELSTVRAGLLVETQVYFGGRFPH